MFKFRHFYSTKICLQLYDTNIFKIQFDQFVLSKITPNHYILQMILYNIPGN